MKNLFKSYRYKILELGVLALYALLLIPILLRFWDLQVYGKWIAIYSLFNLIKVFEFGHSKYVGNLFNKLAPIDPEKAKHILGSAIWGNLVIQTIQLVVLGGIFILGILSFVLDADIRSDHMMIVLSILFLYRILIGSFRGIIVKILNPFGLIYKSFQYSILEKLLEFAILVFAAMFGFSLISLAIIWFFSKTIFSLFILRQLYNDVPDYFPWWGSGSFSEGSKNAIRSLSFAGSTFMDRFMDDGIQLLVSAIMGTSFLPLFKATQTLVNLGSKVSELLLNPILPNVINLYVKEKLNRIFDVFRSYWLFSSFLLFFGYGISLFFLNDFFRIWTNGKLEFSLLLFGGLLVVQLLKVFGRITFNFLMGINKTFLVISTSLIRLLVFFGCFATLPFSPLINLLTAMIIGETVLASLWFPFHLQRIFDFSMKQSIHYYYGLLCQLLFCFILYMLYRDITFLAMFPVIFGIILIWILQYRTISISSRRIVTNSMDKLRTFVFKV